MSNYPRNHPMYSTDPWKSCEAWTYHPDYYTYAFWKFHLLYVERGPKEGQRTW